MAKKPTPVKKTVAKPAPKAKKPDAKKAKAPVVKPAAKAPPKAPGKPAPAAKAPSKPAAKPSGGKPVVTKQPAAKPGSKSPEKGSAAAAPAATGSGRKGITIVTPKPVRKPAAKSISKYPSLGGTLLGPGSPVRKPLIPSGPTQAKHVSLGDGADLTGKKSPFGKKELAKFRALLMQKRSELIGDVKNMEQEALRSNAGSLSNLPQHMADQGSDAYDQALALDLAAVDRRLIKEIEDALKRIDDGTYGLCELTGKAIKLERLEEIPWARHSIEAAREVERRTVRP